MSFLVYFETLDDVVFEQEGSTLDLIQYKHHKNADANLTNASSDIWKSLRVWMEGRANKLIPDDANLYLVTTQTAADDTIAKYLTLGQERNEKSALIALRQVAITSTSATNVAAYALFNSLTSKQQEDLIASITIIAKAPTANHIDTDIRRELALSVRADRVESLVTRLEAWWLSACLRHLIKSSANPISSEELQAQLDDIREQLKDDALPLDPEVMQALVEIDAYEGQVFVHQARLANIREPRVLAAVRDYYRAYEQRSRWMRENLLLVGELDKYERRLCEEWQMMFDRTADNFGEMQAETQRQEMARQIYDWVEQAEFRLREKVNEPAITRGSFHMLANELRVGWHPDFKARLQHLLVPAPVAA
ncbi:ABC-three component system protein [Pseudoxanthomonas suwonensis]|uniref:ABC-three component system protein n=1 Tax=Pseudoxanthomonas suwonensis TaxID=314722 RepID=UPI001E48CE32|nr:ABC-three component system protein [Pseudoxanthomonas suwonensis]